MYKRQALEAVEIPGFQHRLCRQAGCTACWQWLGRIAYGQHDATCLQKRTGFQGQLPCTCPWFDGSHALMAYFEMRQGVIAVSYTHLDVYKRQSIVIRKGTVGAVANIEKPAVRR